jgi:hypothetical protein
VPPSACRTLRRRCYQPRRAVEEFAAAVRATLV